MGNFNLIPFLFIGNSTIPENQLHAEVLAVSRPIRKVKRNNNIPNNNHFKTVIKILVFLLFTSCIKEMNYEGDMLTMINSARTTGYNCQGEKYKPVGIVKWDSQLEAAALIQCNYMDSVDELSHNWKDGTGLKDRLLIVGYTSDRAGENIARGANTEADVLENWLNSPPHCETIMFGGYDIVAVARKGNYWTMVLGYK
jgi:uncharacterized protein YkwD